MRRGGLVRNASRCPPPKAAIAVCLLGAALTAAQEPKFSADVNVVNILANVFDQRGALVETLAKHDFVVEDNGQRQDIRYFSKQSELPLTLGLLVDTSGSMTRMRREEHDASMNFLKQVLRPKHDRAFVMDFDEQVRILEPFTSSRRRLDAALSHLTPYQWRRLVRTSGGAFAPEGRTTALFDAVYVASEALMKNQHGRKALVVLSDGMDIQSEYTLADAVAAAQGAETLVYAIYIYDPVIDSLTVQLSPPVSGKDPQSPTGFSKRDTAAREVLNKGRDALSRICRETGGRLFEATDDDSMSRIYGRIQAELRSQYSLGFVQNDALLKPGFHKLRVSTVESGLTVQARDGYYAAKR
ncbi:MAG TPA: VWA domain-containing protein [Bryobacteraceae bacterium]|nr:VWA domain-containing protein [Bryobacteraceae bacterium]